MSFNRDYIDIYIFSNHVLFKFQLQAILKFPVMQFKSVVHVLKDASREMPPSMRKYIDKRGRIAITLQSQ